MINDNKEKKRRATTVSTGKYDENGKLIRVYVTGRTKAEFEEKLSDVRHSINSGTYANDKNITFEQYAEQWLSIEKASISGRLQKKYQNVIRNHCKTIHNKKLSKISRFDIVDLMNAQADHPDNRRMLKIAVNAIFECAIEDGLLYHNVCRKIKTPRYIAPEKRPLSDSEKDAIRRCSACRIGFTPEEKAFVDTLFATGIRHGEAVALMKNDLDFRSNKIHIQHSYDYSNPKNRIKDTKNHENRLIEAPQWLMSELLTYTRTNSSLFVFPSPTGQIMCEKTFKRFWGDIYGRINACMGGNLLLKVKNVATDLTPHIFRHNYATMLFYNDVDVKEAQRLLGHNDIRVTLEIYTHLQKNNKTTEKINQIAL